MPAFLLLSFLIADTLFVIKNGCKFRKFREATLARDTERYDDDNTVENNGTCHYFHICKNRVCKGWK